MIRTLLSLAVIAGIAAGAGYALHFQLGLGLEMAVIGAGVVLSLLAGLWSVWRSHALLTRAVRLNEAVAGFETDILRKIEALERRQGEETAPSSVFLARLARLETELLDREKSPVAKVEQDLPGTFDDQNVIPIETAKRRTEIQPASPRQNAAPAEDEGLSVRLQPIVQLPGQAPLAFEALAYSLNGTADTALSSLQPAGGVSGRVALDLAMFEEIARVVRYLEREGVNLPVVYRISGDLLAGTKQWSRIAELLGSDMKMARRLVICIDFRELQALNQAAQTRLLEASAHGARLCVSGIRDEVDLAQMGRSGEFSYAMVPIRNLLTTSGKHEEPAYMRIRPAAESRDMQVIASSVSETYQVASLIDADIFICQGDFLSTPRKLKLYDDTDGIEAAKG